MTILTAADKKILHFMEQDLNWSDMGTKESRVTLLKLANELGVEDVPESPSDIDEDVFDYIKDSIFAMGDGILDEQVDDVAATKVAEGEENTMEQNITEEATMGQKAKEFAGAAQEKIEDAAKYIMDNVPAVKESVKNVASMDNDTLAAWLKYNAHKFYNTIKNKLEENKEQMEEFSDFAPGVKNDIAKHESILKTFANIMDDENKNGWGKFKSIVSALVKWIVRILIKAAQIALKIAVVIVVGAIKIGAVMIDTGFNVFGVTNKEVLTPAYKAAKKAHRAHKAKKAAKYKEELRAAQAAALHEADLDDYIDDYADEDEE